MVSCERASQKLSNGVSCFGVAPVFPGEVQNCTSAEAVMQEGRYEAVVMKYEVVAVQCKVQSARGGAEAVTKEATVEEVERREETETGILVPGRPL